MNFFIEWVIFYCSCMFMMLSDNLFWIPTSPEYEKFKQNKFPLKVEGKEYNSRLDYIFRYRILSVLTSWRDIVPGIITSGILALIW